jgi:hypothetical protein
MLWQKKLMAGGKIMWVSHVDVLSGGAKGEGVFMDGLWISNLAPETSDDELVALVTKYAPHLDCVKVQRVQGDGSHPGALLGFKYRSLDPASGTEAVRALLEPVKDLSRRLDGLYWKGHALSSSTLVLGWC